ncbi:MFS transporter [Pseudonocardia sp. TRM90224]|uniref:MFS transporter n=1 Tax=Pseudonocardia sp. TRM90224 TaxID=2812678 RepID=UPI001E336F6A|nr:MFS transporter [Pseudonocardia sp. TRM90224]
MSRRSPNLVLAALFLGMFVLGSAEMLVVGVLTVIAADLQVSIPAAGALVTAYALGLAIGGPLLTALTIRLDRRTVLIGALVLCVVGSLVAVLTPSYGLFLAARVVTGALQGLFIAAGFSVGISVVAPERAGQAISAVFGGVATSAAFGVPLGTLVGQQLGWRGSFLALAVLSVAALAATAVLVPSVVATGTALGSQARHAFAPRVLAVLLLSVVLFAAVFAALTYLAPFLAEVTGVSGALVSAFLLAYGVATALGSVGGGRFADRNAALTLVVGTIGTAAALLALYLLGAHAFAVALALLALGLFGMGSVPSIQYRTISLAGPGAALAQSLPASAANLGIALGSFVGGIAINRLDVTAAVFTAVGIAAVAVVLAAVTSRIEAPAVQEAVGGSAG